jgi:hypothetical protein
VILAKKYPGASGTARKASSAALLDAAARCIASAPPQTRAARGGSPSKALALPTRQGRSIAAPALYGAPVMGLEKRRAAHGVEQREAVHIGRAAVDGAHGACGADADQFSLLAGNIRVAKLGEAIFDEIILHGVWSFLTTRADYSDGVEASYKAEAMTVSSRFVAPGVYAAEHGAKAACQYIKYARSGRVADAVREHSFFASLTRSSWSRWHGLLFVPLTPARWLAYKLAGKFSASIGSGGAVLARTVQNQRQNLQTIDIPTFFRSVLRFWVFASRYTCVRVHARPCAYGNRRNPRTSEPHQFIVINHRVIGSSTGSVRFQPEPALSTMADGDGFLPVLRLIAGINGARCASSGLLRGWGGESFGVFGLVGLQLAADRCRARLARSDDGFMRLCGHRSGHVGIPMLERLAERLTNAALSMNWPLPIGKARTIAQVRQGTPPMPPFRRGPSSSSMARQTCQIWIGFPSLQYSGLKSIGQKQTRGNGWRQIGSGKGRAVRFNPVEAGQGNQIAAEKLHRIAQAIGGRADVN